MSILSDLVTKPQCVGVSYCPTTSSLASRLRILCCWTKLVKPVLQLYTLYNLYTMYGSEQLKTSAATVIVQKNKA